MKIVQSRKDPLRFSAKINPRGVNEDTYRSEVEAGKHGHVDNPAVTFDQWRFAKLSAELDLSPEIAWLREQSIAFSYDQPKGIEEWPIAIVLTTPNDAMRFKLRIDPAAKP